MLCPAAQELLPPLWRTEMPLVRVIVDMEAAGLAVNEDILNTGRAASALSVSAECAECLALQCNAKEPQLAAAHPGA